MTILKTLTFEFGTIELFDHYVITTMKEGVTVIPRYNEELVVLANSHFAGKPFAYITNRKNSYAVDPSVYYKTSKIENLVAFAVVSKNAIAEKTVAVEKMFLDRPFRLFKEMDEAIAWVSKIVERQAL